MPYFAFAFAAHLKEMERSGDMELLVAHKREGPTGGIFPFTSIHAPTNIREFSSKEELVAYVSKQAASVWDALEEN